MGEADLTVLVFSNVWCFSQETLGVAVAFDIPLFVWVSPQSCASALSPSADSPGPGPAPFILQVQRGRSVLASSRVDSHLDMFSMHPSARMSLSFQCMCKGLETEDSNFVSEAPR